MAENENVVEMNEVQPTPQNQKPSAGKKILGGIKERCRKFVVNLKRRPMNIAFFVLVLSTAVNLCCLGNYSQLGLSYNYSLESQGLCVFVNQLVSILVLLLFLNSFPKRSKKPKIVMLVLCFVFMAALIGVDLYLYIKWTANYLVDIAGANDTYLDALHKFYFGAVNGILAHLILVILSLILTATYPLYGKLINKINTKKVIESTELKEEIDTSEEV